VTLREKIVEEIRERGPVSFSRYMELCLYHPELGYYSRLAEQFGKGGDFYTCSDVHAVFGRLLARQFEEMWRVLGSPPQIEVVELGPGRGLFAQDVLDWSQKKFPDFYNALRYRLIEQSPVLKERLQITLRTHFVTGKASLANIDAKSASAPVIVFANEFFDALPVDVLGFDGELRISERNGHFQETWAPPTAEQLEFLDRYSIHPEAGERVEAALISQQSMSDLAAGVRQGLAVIIDYGYTRNELLAGRFHGTVMAYRHHSANLSPYEAPGEQDITAHVNFTALAAAAEGQRMRAEPLLTQSQFLLGIGEPNQFADAFEDCQQRQEHAKVALQLKHLVTPAGMGEIFHVLVLSKGVEPEKIAGLSGLSFSTSRL
jgi:SAM-dependent MidA family methyltransferase